jgi:hypothetical protein
MVVCRAIFAASWSGYPYAPVLIAGNAMLVRLCIEASLRLSRYALLRRLASLLVPSRYRGPTVWMTYFALRFPAVVTTAFPVGQLPMVLHSCRMASPPARWMAPSTPPPPARLLFAAFTIASVDSLVISPHMRMSVDALMVCSIQILQSFLRYNCSFITLVYNKAVMCKMGEWGEVNIIIFRMKKNLQFYPLQYFMSHFYYFVQLLHSRFLILCSHIE